MYRWARHPMYALFLYAAMGGACATLNSVVTAALFGPLVVLAISRVEVEESQLRERFGAAWDEYCERAPALGGPGCWGRGPGCRGRQGGARGQGGPAGEQGVRNALIRRTGEESAAGKGVT